MHRESDTNSDEAGSSDLVWNTILEVTSRVSGDQAKAIHVLLYTILSEESKETVRLRLRCCRRLLSLLTAPFSRRLPKRPQRHPLFAFIFNTAANMNNLLPVFRAAQERGLHPTVLKGHGVTLDPECLAAKADFIRASGLMALTSLNERFRALTGARALYSAIYREFQFVAPRWADLVRSNRLRILTELALFLAVTHGLRRLYASWQPSCLVSTSDLWPFDHAVFAEARRMGIPSFVIQHGTTSRCWWPCVADKLLLWGERFRDELLALGAPADRLAVCGMPAADSLFRRYQQDGFDRRREAASSYVILSHTHARKMCPNLYSKYGNLVKAVVAETPSVQWLIKLHPSEDECYYKDMAEFQNLTILPRSTTLEEAITQTDVACTLYSTAGLEAMMMQRPLVVFDLAPIIQEYAWWPKHGGGFYVSTAEAMRDFVKNASSAGTFLSDLVTKQNQFLAQAFAHPGQAAEAVLDTIEETRTANAARNAGKLNAAQSGFPEQG
jgi:hypothetical protein